MIVVRTIFKNDPLINNVIELGDKNSKTLGHFPKEAFLECAARGQIIGALEDENVLLGYILYRIVKTKNKISITHFCVDAKAKGKKVPLLLFNKLLELFENYFNGIGLYCREDYNTANHLWNRLGFKPVGKKRSRSIKEKYLTYWWYEFANKDLFTKDYSETKDVINVLLDANIIINLRDRYSRHNFECVCLLDDWIATDVEYYYASEIYTEIHRDKSEDRKSITQKHLKSFKQLCCNASKINSTFSEIHKLLNGKSPNDISDEKQLAEAVVSGIRYFITLDSWLLENKELIFNSYDVNVFRPSEFITEFDRINNYEDYQSGRLSGTEFIYSKLSTKDIEIATTKFLDNKNGERKSEFSKKIHDLVADKVNAELRIISTRDSALAILGLNFIDKAANIEVLRITDFLLKEILFKHLVYEAIKLSQRRNIEVIKIKDDLLLGNYRELIKEYGFFQKGEYWIKLSYNRIIKSSELFSAFPETVTYLDEEIYTSLLKSPEDKRAKLLYYVERLLWPLKFSDLNIPTYIIPIKPFWASHLFDYFIADETIFGSNAKLMWNRENIYYRNVSPKIENEKGRILWYVSAGEGSLRSSSVVATSYLDEIYIDRATDIFKRFKNFGIYTWQDINILTQNNADQLIKALKFSDTEVFTDVMKFNDLNVICNEIEHKNFFVQSVSKLSKDFFIEVYSRLSPK